MCVNFWCFVAKDNKAHLTECFGWWQLQGIKYENCSAQGRMQRICWIYKSIYWKPSEQCSRGIFSAKGIHWWLLKEHFVLRSAWTDWLYITSRNPLQIFYGVSVSTLLAHFIVFDIKTKSNCAGIHRGCNCPTLILTLCCTMTAALSVITRISCHTSC